VTATVVGIDRFSDLAVLQVDPHEVQLTPVPWGDSDAVVPGEPVAVIGAPFGYKSSITRGIVSATHRTVLTQVSDSSIADAIQLDASVNRGNSGGPVFNARGQLIGIAQQIRSTTTASEGVAFAVPSDTARRSAEQIIADGKPHYAYVGMTTTTVTPQLARLLGLPVPAGVLVTESTGPASEAGISAGTHATLYAGHSVQVGDQLVELAGQKVLTSDDVPRIVSRIDAGSKVAAVYYHGGKRMTTTIATRERTA
jgi:S1-C subfamily serine protease